MPSPPALWENIFQVLQLSDCINQKAFDDHTRWQDNIPSNMILTYNKVIILKQAEQLLFKCQNYFVIHVCPIFFIDNLAPSWMSFFGYYSLAPNLGWHWK